MKPVKMLVPLSGTARDRLALQTALAAAEPFAAHVVALFVHADPRESVPYGELPLAPDIVQDLIDTAADLEKAASKAARSTLATLAAEAGVRIVGSPQKADAVTMSYCEARGRLARVLEQSAKLSDLVVFAPIRETDEPEWQEGFLYTLTKLQRPVLLSAEKPPKRLGCKVAVGWDGSIACAHALMAALPYLENAREIGIVCVGNSTRRSAQDAADYLALCGLGAIGLEVAQREHTVAETLLEAAAKGSYDLLVAGGYGHSRLMESIFGGVTEHIVSHSAIPVFMTH